MRFIKRIFLILSLLGISFAGNRYGTRIPIEKTEVYIGQPLETKKLHFSPSIPGLSSTQGFNLTDSRQECFNCDFYKNTFTELKILDITRVNIFYRGPQIKKVIDDNEKLQIYKMVSLHNNQKVTSYYCIINNSNINKLEYILHKTIKHFSQDFFENLLAKNNLIFDYRGPNISDESISSSGIIEKIKLEESDLPISFRFALSPESEAFILSKDSKRFIKKPAQTMFSTGVHDQALLKEKLFYSFNSLVLNKNKIGNGMLSLCKSAEMITSNGQIIADKNLELLFLSNTPQVLKKYDIQFVRDYGLFLKPLHKSFCWLLDNTIIALNYSSWSIPLFVFIVSIMLLPAFYFDALYKNYTQKINLRKELLKTKKSNDPARYESELAKLTQSQVPYFAKHFVANIFEVIIQYSISVFAVYFSYPMRFINFLWIKDLFQIEGYSIFNLYGILNFVPPFFLKHVGALCIITFLVVIEPELQLQENNVTKLVIFMVGLAFLCKTSISQLLILSILRITARIFRSFFIRYLEKKDSIII